MHIKSSFYNAMHRISDAFINAMPGRGSYTLNHKVRVVKSTSNGPGKKTTEWQSKLKSPPIDVGKYRVTSEEFPMVPQKPNQTSTGVRRDKLLSQSARVKVLAAMRAAMKEYNAEKAELEAAASGATSSDVAMPSSPSPSDEKITTQAKIQCQPVKKRLASQPPIALHATDSNIIRFEQAAPECNAPETAAASAPLPLKRKMGCLKIITIQVEVHGKLGKPRLAPQSPIASHAADSNIIRSEQAASECNAPETEAAPAPLPLKGEKVYIKQITTQAEIHGKPGKKRLAPQPAIMSKRTISLEGTGDTTSSEKTESVVTENVANILPRQIREEVQQKIALQPLKDIYVKPIKNSSLHIKKGGSLPSLVVVPEYPPPVIVEYQLKPMFAQQAAEQKILRQAMIGELTTMLENVGQPAQLAAPSSPKPGPSVSAAIVALPVVRDSRVRLRSASARTEQPAQAQASNNELYTVFARRRTREAMARAEQLIAELEASRRLVTLEA